MATQVKSGLPGGEFSVIDNSAAGAISTNVTAYSAGSGGPPTGGGAGNLTGSGVPNFDTTSPGATTQGTNPFADTGTVLIDASGNDTVYADPQCSTVKGNPVSNTPPIFAVVTKVLTNPASATINFKNPA